MVSMRLELNIERLCREADLFSKSVSRLHEPNLFGVTDGKAVGTFLEHKFQDFLTEKYVYEKGNSAKGIDFPQLGVDIKVTSIKQPQSSCPFRSARQKVYGLGYGLLIFVYDKFDDPEQKTTQLNILHTVFVEAGRTADFQTTSYLINIIQNQGNADDIVAYFIDKNLPLDEIQAHELAEEILNHPPKVGFLTISNALQWRLQYSRVIEQAGTVDGVIRIHQHEE